MLIFPQRPKNLSNIAVVTIILALVYVLCEGKLLKNYGSQRDELVFGHAGLFCVLHSFLIHLELVRIHQQ